jgi:hypothetical protein
MFYTVHNTNTGSLLDISTSLPDALPSDYTVKGWDQEVPDLYYYQWNPITTSFEPKANIDRIMTVHQFLNRFTAQERIVIKEVAKTNAALSDFMDMLNSASFVDPDELEVYGGLYYLALLGLITQNRIPEIIA